MFVTYSSLRFIGVIFKLKWIKSFTKISQNMSDFVRTEAFFKTQFTFTLLKINFDNAFLINKINTKVMNVKGIVTREIIAILGYKIGIIRKI